jgi:membrane-associated phospholipid phosphatase
MAGKRESLFGRGILGSGWVNAAFGIVLAAAVYSMGGLYGPLNHGPALLNLRTPLDDALPVVSLFAIPYVSLMPYIYASLFLFFAFRTRSYQSAALAFLVAQATSFVCYFFLQSEVVRPVLSGSDGLTSLVNQVYAGDSPYNDFPSLHTSLSAILAIHWFRIDRRLGIVAWAWSSLIIASTVLIKQHYVADLAAGGLLAYWASRLSNRLVPWQVGSGLCPGYAIIGGNRSHKGAMANACV